jgi:4-hydroxy-3-methylbut-2-enyl diphosphate reductase
MTAQAPLTVLLATPRGFCAGVDRAILIVERAIEKYGAPVYVRHEIVHNRFVVEALETKGAIFVDDLAAVPDDRPVVFSAHGVPKTVPAEAVRRGMFYLDATCPLVSKVHSAAEHHFKADRHIVLIGHDGHPKVVGTIGQLPEGAITLVEDEAQAEQVVLPADKELAFSTQTTLSVDDTAGIVSVLQRRYPQIRPPRSDDICYATTNRQSAVKAMANGADAVLVLGSPNSSNSMRLVEVARKAGCANAHLVQRAAQIDWEKLGPLRRIGITAGASAPEILVQETLAALRQRYAVTIEEVVTAREDVHFNLPRVLET